MVPPGAEGREGEGAVAGPPRRRGMGRPPRGRGQSGLARPLPAPATGGTGLTPHYSAACLRLLLPGAGAAGAARAVQAPPGPTASLVRPLVAACPRALPTFRRFPLPPTVPPFPRPSPRNRPFPLGSALSPPGNLISMSWTRLAPYQYSQMFPHSHFSTFFPFALLSCYFLHLNFSLTPSL